MFGYFGKGITSPAPAPPPASIVTPEPAIEKEANTSQISSNSSVEEGTSQNQPFQSPLSSKEPSETDLIKSRLQALQATVNAKKAEQDSKLKSLHLMQAKQAAYGRDTKQIRPKKAGYATESEKIMGGRTGYGNYSFGNLGQTIDQVSAEIRSATKLVERLTTDVKHGMATRSELQDAMTALATKIQEAKGLATKTGLQGFGGDKTSINPIWIVAGVGLLFFMLRSR